MKDALNALDAALAPEAWKILEDIEKELSIGKGKYFSDILVQKVRSAIAMHRIDDE